MEYLVNINVLDLRSKMLNNTIFDFEAQFEINEKIDKFQNFSKANMPRSSYVVDELKYKESEFDKHMSPGSEKSYLNILGKLSQIEFAARHQVRQQEEEPEKEPSDEDIKLENLDKLDSVISPEQLEGLGDIEGLDELANAPIIDDVEGLGSDGEGENILNLMTDQRVVRENNNLEGLLGTEEATQGGPNHKTLVARRKEDLKRKISKEMSNIMLYKTQGKEEVIYLTQKGFNEKEVKKTNWIYLYGLPYEITDEQALKEDIKSSFRKCIGEIKNIKFFQFKDYLNVTQTSKRIKVYDSLDEVFDPEGVLASQKNNTLQGGSPNTLQTAEQPTPALPINEKKKDLAKQKIRRTESVLKNIQAKSNKRLDKSYALIELADSESKAKALLPDVRIFGLYITGRLCQVDDADHKLTLSCYNVHWGSSLKSFTDFVNNLFEQNNMMDLKVETPKKFENKILTKFYVLLRFNSFFNTLRAMQILENQMFERRPLRVHHLYGSLKLHQSEYSEVIDVETNAVKQERVNQIKMREISRISSLPDDEEIHDWSIDGFPSLEVDHDHVEEFEMENDGFEVLKIKEDKENKWYQSSHSDDERYDDIMASEEEGDKQVMSAKSN